MSDLDFGESGQDSNPKGLFSFSFSLARNDNESDTQVSEGDFADLERELQSLLPDGSVNELRPSVDYSAGHARISRQPRCGCCWKNGVSCISRWRAFCLLLCTVLLLVAVGVISFVVLIHQLTDIKVLSADMEVDMDTSGTVVPFAISAIIDNPCKLHVVVHNVTAVYHWNGKKAARITLDTIDLPRGPSERFDVNGAVDFVDAVAVRNMLVNFQATGTRGTPDVFVSATAYFLGIPFSTSRQVAVPEDSNLNITAAVDNPRVAAVEIKRSDEDVVDMAAVAQVDATLSVAEFPFRVRAHLGAIANEVVANGVVIAGAVTSPSTLELPGRVTVSTVMSVNASAAGANVVPFMLGVDEGVEIEIMGAPCTSQSPALCFILEGLAIPIPVLDAPKVSFTDLGASVSNVAITPGVGPTLHVASVLALQLPVPISGLFPGLDARVNCTVNPQPISGRDTVVVEKARSGILSPYSMGVSLSPFNITHAGNVSLNLSLTVSVHDKAALLRLGNITETGSVTFAVATVDAGTAVAQLLSSVRFSWQVNRNVSSAPVTSLVSIDRTTVVFKDGSLGAADGNMSLTLPTATPLSLRTPPVFADVVWNGVSLARIKVQGIDVPSGVLSVCVPFSVVTLDTTATAAAISAIFAGSPMVTLCVKATGREVNGVPDNIAMYFLEGLKWSYDFSSVGLPFVLESVAAAVNDFSSDSIMSSIGVTFPNPASALTPYLMMLKLRVSVPEMEVNCDINLPSLSKSTKVTVFSEAMVLDSDPSEVVVLRTTATPAVDSAARILSDMVNRAIAGTLMRVGDVEFTVFDRKDQSSPVNGVRFVWTAAALDCSAVSNVSATLLGAPSNGFASAAVNFLATASVALQLETPEVLFDLFVHGVPQYEGVKVGRIGLHFSVEAQQTTGTCGVEHHGAVVSTFILDDLPAVPAIASALSKGHVVSLSLKKALGLIRENILQKLVREVMYDVVLPSLSLDPTIDPGITVNVVKSTSQKLVFGVLLDMPLWVPFPIYSGSLDICGKTGSPLAPVLTGHWDAVPIITGLKPQFFLTLHGENRGVLEQFISDVLAGRNVTLTTSAHVGALQEGYDAVTFEYAWPVGLPDTLPSSPDSVARCIEMANIDVGYLNILKNQCSFAAVVRAWFDNPSPIGFSIVDVEFDVYFDNPNGVGCIPHIGCMYDPKMDYHFANVVASRDGKGHEMPVAVGSSASASVSIPIKAVEGASDELCFRLATEYEWHGSLVLHIRNGKVTLKIGEFVFAVRFEVPRYVASKAAANKPCSAA